LSSRASTVRRWRQVRRNPKIVTGVAILGLFVLVIVANPLLWATVWDGQERLYDPVIGFDHMIIHPSAPSGAHWLGTDSLGRDVTSMFTLAARSSVTVAVAAALVSGVVSLCLGSLAAYHRKWVDAVVTHTSDAMVLLPALLAVWVVGLGRPDASFGALQVGAVFGLVYGLGPATAAVRAAGLVVMARPFVEAARLVGAGGYWTMSRHLWPHLVPHAAVQAMIGVTGAIVAEAFLNFRSAVGGGIGFGYLVYEGLTWQEMLAGLRDIPWWVLLTGTLGITMLAAAFYLIGIGLREVFDPRGVRTRRRRVSAS
jgi:peptide/nickel transport system permease protein